MLRRMLGDRSGTTTVEFTVILPLFLAMFFAIVEFSLAFYWWKSAEKATMIGVRMAVVRDAAVPLPALNERVIDSQPFGAPCRLDPSPCDDFGTLTCVGGAGCDGAAFDAIVQRMQQIFPAIEPGQVGIVYEYGHLGFAGGPVVPIVTVELGNQARGADPVPAPFIALNAVFGLLGGDARAPINLPPIRATLTGEDLNTSGAG